MAMHACIFNARVLNLMVLSPEISPVQDMKHLLQDKGGMTISKDVDFGSHQLTWPASSADIHNSHFEPLPIFLAGLQPPRRGHGGKNLSHPMMHVAIVPLKVWLPLISMEDGCSLRSMCLLFPLFAVHSCMPQASRSYSLH